MQPPGPGLIRLADIGKWFPPPRDRVREILGGLLRNHFFVRESDYALYGDDVKARAREYFSSLVEGSIASAADNSMTYLTMRNDTRLTSLHFSASGGQTDFTCTNSSGGVTDAATEGQCQATPGNVWSSDLSSWMASVNADPALISIELAPLAELIADGTKRENMQAMTLAYQLGASVVVNRVGIVPPDTDDPRCRFIGNQ